MISYPHLKSFGCIGQPFGFRISKIFSSTVLDSYRGQGEDAIPGNHLGLLWWVCGEGGQVWVQSVDKGAS